MWRSGVIALLALGAGAGPAAAAEHVVNFGGRSYTPAEVIWLAGDTVTFQGDFDAHPLRWANPDLDGQPDEARPDFSGKPPGVYRFFCDFHSSEGMRGVVRKPDGVQPAQSTFTVRPAAPQTNETVFFTAPNGAARYEWDLDGDGTFERTGNSVWRKYPVAGQVTVRLRVMEEDGDFSPPSEQTVTVSSPPPPPPPSGGGGIPPAGGDATPAPSGSPSDTARPVASLQTRSARARKGRTAKIGFRSSERGRASASFKVKGRQVGSGRLTIARAGAQSLTLTLNRRGRSLLRKARLKGTLRLEVFDAAGNRRVLSATLTIRR